MFGSMPRVAPALILGLGIGANLGLSGCQCYSRNEAPSAPQQEPKMHDKKPAISYAFNSIRTGGQTGVDRAALDVASNLQIPFAGWIPAGRGAEDGPISSKYEGLIETPSADVNQRTEWNVRDSDGTLVLSAGKPKDGTNWTIEACKIHNKPHIQFDLSAGPTEAQMDEFKKWIEDHKIKSLNVGGPRESHKPGFVYSESVKWLTQLFNACRT